MFSSSQQMEVSPFFQQHDIGDYCLSSSVVVINSESLVKGTRYRHPVVKQIANNLGILPIQVSHYSSILFRSHELIVVFF